LKLKKIFPLSLSGLLLSLWAPLSWGAEAITPAITSAQAAKVYGENCAVCHGERGDGQSRARFGLTPPPRDFTSAPAAAQLTREVMINRVTHGKPGTAMVAWQGRLSSAEIEGVVDYIRASFMTVAPAAASAEEKNAAVPAAAPAAAATPLASGQKIYEENCRVCHGDRGNGATWTNTVLDPAPRNFTAPQSRRILTRKRMLASVTYGRKNTAMMPFATRLSKGEIEAVVDYIRATFMKGPVISDAGAVDLAAAAGGGGHGASAPHGQSLGGIAGSAMAPRSHEPQAAADAAPAAVDMKAPFPGDLKGNFIKGRKFYLENCSTCHGARGDGMGPRSHFIEPKPRNFLNPESRQQLNRPALFKAIFLGKPGTVMPAWGKVLTPQELANVAEYVFQDFVHPNPDAIKPQLEEEPELPEVTDKKKAD
jgi:mono/diheme cytochrome c family protein